MIRKAMVAAVLGLVAFSASAAPAEAAPVRAAAVDRLCSPWAQVIPNVWAIVCLDRSGALFQPYGEMRNYSSTPVSMDQFLYLNNNLHATCGQSPATAPPGATLSCTNNTWRTAGSPRWATGYFYVNSSASITLSTPSFP